jgi:hypothetical protein
MSVLIYQNPTSDPLPLWFYKHIDPTNILVNTGSYLQTSFPNGNVALIRSAPLPDAFLQVSGPIEDVFATRPGTTVVIGLIQSQDVKLGEFGYSRDAVQQLFLAIAGNLFE